MLITYDLFSGYPALLKALTFSFFLLNYIIDGVIHISTSIIMITTKLFINI